MLKRKRRRAEKEGEQIDGHFEWDAVEVLEIDRKDRMK